MPTRRSYQLKQAPRIKQHNDNMLLQEKMNEEKRQEEERKRQEEEDLLRAESDRYRDLNDTFKTLRNSKMITTVKACKFLNISMKEYNNMRKEYSTLSKKYNNNL